MNRLLRERLPELFGLDLRALALFRVTLAAITALDLLCRLVDVRAFYTDAGVLPRALLAQDGESWRLSLHLAGGETWFAALLLLLQLALALMVLAGHRTRIATVLTFVLLGSLHGRNPAILSGADAVITGLWFWAMFLPLNARWSCDAALSPQPPPDDNRHLSWASAGLTLQVLSLYFFSAALQSGPEWWPDGSALWYALSLDRHATPLGVALRDGAPGLLAPLTWTIWLAQWLGPLLALAPVATRPLRFVVVIFFMLLHLGFLATLGTGPFPLAGLAGLAALLGTGGWDRATARAQHGRFLKIYYDDTCAFCAKSAVLLRHFLVLPRTELLPAQGSVRASALMQAQGSWVVIDGDDVAHTKWSGLVALLRHSLLFGWAWRLAALRLWEKPGNAVYDWLGRHRGVLGRAAAAWLPERPATFAAGRGAQRVAAAFVLGLLAWNLASVHALPRFVAAALAPPVRLLRLDQPRPPLAPAPGRDDGWFLAPARLADGTEADLLRPGAPLSYAKPARIADTPEASRRWRTFHERLYDGASPAQLRAYAAYRCRAWNAGRADGARAQSVKLVFMLERSPPPGQRPEGIEQRVLWRHDCDAG